MAVERQLFKKEINKLIQPDAEHLTGDQNN